MNNKELDTKNKFVVGTESESVPGNYTSNFFYNNLTSQQQEQQRMGHAALQQRDALSMMRDQTLNGNIFAAAVRQQLVASLASPSLPMYHQLGGPPRTGSYAGVPFIHDLQGSTASSRGGYLQLDGGGATPKFSSLLETSTTASSASPTPGGGGTTQQQRSETTTQIPCQARGMAADHNSMTANFEIPSSASHGQHLYCSHPICRAAGVKFRYCFFCKKPVTKQNFRSRHLHAADIKNNDQDDAVPSREQAKKKHASSSISEKKRTSAEADLEETEQQEGDRRRVNNNTGGGELVPQPLLIRRAPPHITAASRPSRLHQRHEEMPVDSIKLQQHSTVIAPSSYPRMLNICESTLMAETGPRRTRTINTLDFVKYAPSTTASTTDPSNKEEEEASSYQRSPGGEKQGRQQEEATYLHPMAIFEGDTQLKKVSRSSRWTSLLSERPRGLASEIGAWITEVLAVSDMSRRWQVEEGVAADAGNNSVVPSPSSGSLFSAEQLSRWKALLDERRPPSDSAEEMGTQHATSWLSRVLEISCVDYGSSGPSSSVGVTPAPSKEERQIEIADDGGAAAAAVVLDEVKPKENEKAPAAVSSSPC